MALQAGWLDIFPHNTLLNSDTDVPLLVDEGGNVDHDMERFRQAHPEIATRVYLQNRLENVKLFECSDPVNKIDYDFSTPQSIKDKTCPAQLR